MRFARRDLSRGRHVFRRYDTIKAGDIARIYSGFEICSHGANHCAFAGKTVEELKQEIYPDLEFFEKITGKKVVGAIYPGGVYDNVSVENLKLIGIKFCRTIPDGTHGFCVPKEWECWVPTCHFQDEKIFEIINAFSAVDKDKDVILHIFGHSYELEYKDKDWWGVFEEICKRVTGIENVEYASLGEVYDYFQR